jgi:hypothetical protein
MNISENSIVTFRIVKIVYVLSHLEQIVIVSSSLTSCYPSI